MCRYVSVPVRVESNGNGVTFHVDLQLPDGVRVDANVPIEISIGPGPVTIHGGQPVRTAPIQPPRRSEPVRRSRGVFEPTKPTGAVQDHFHGLMRQGALLQQSDYRLAQRGLLIPDGGLCATTSAINALHAAFRREGRDTTPFRESDGLVHELVSKCWTRFNKDARDGLDFSTLGMVINDVGNTLDSTVGVHAKTRGYGVSSSNDFAKLAQEADSLTLLSITTGPRKAHAIALLDVDTSRQTLTYSDPNHPNQAMVVPYDVTYNNQIKVHGWGDYGVLQDVLNIRTRSFDSRPFNNWKDYANKRVLITASDGRKMLQSVTRVDRPSSEYPSGRVVAGFSLFGSASHGTWTPDDIAAIEEVPEPSAKEKKRFDKLVGSKVKFQFQSPHDDARYGDIVYEVLGVSDERDLSKHPFGGIIAKKTDESWASEYVVPYEVLRGAEIIDAKVTAKKKPAAKKKKATRKKRNKPV